VTVSLTIDSFFPFNHSFTKQWALKDTIRSNPSKMKETHAFRLRLSSLMILPDRSFKGPSTTATVSPVCKTLDEAIVP
jgi:hypothetical protein